MRLKELKYIEPGFSIEGVNLNYVSLIVGNNAVGKSRVISVIMKLYQLILQKYDIRESDFFEYDVVFADGEVDIRYRFVCQAGEVFLEYLDDSYSHYLDRQCGVTNLYGESVNPPKNKLCVNVRRDTEKYPEIEKIVRWAEHLYLLKFGHTDIYASDSEQGIVAMYEKLDVKQRKGVIDMMSDMGYDIEEIKVGEVCPSLKLLLISEKDVLCVLRFEDLSKAMQKTLYISVLLNYILTKDKDSRTVIVDDLCEGLDRHRSTGMGKFIYQFCIKNDIQLIATTNDIFLMDVVNLNYWNVLRREGGKVIAMNMYNAEQMFLDFKSRNLHNFEILDM